MAKSRLAEDSDFAPAKQHDGYGHAITITLIVIAAFALRYWFNFVTPHVNNYGSCDASEYLRNGQLVYNLKHMPAEFWQQCWQALQGDAPAATVDAVRKGFAPMKEFAQGGPIFPIFLALSYAVAGVPYDQLNWQVPLFAQTIFSALTCGLIALTAGLAFSRPAGYLAGLIAIAYPAFIVNSGRLYSESHAAFLLSAVLYITVRGFCVETGYGRAFWQSILNGIASMALQLTRSVLILVTLALIPLTFIQYGLRKGLLSIVGLLLGFAVVVAPWMAFQYLAFGTTSLVVDRVGNYNFFIGNNTDTAGWLSFPYPDGSGVKEKPMTTLAKEAIQKNPRRWLSLQEDKPLRLFKFPWNDFRTPVGPIEFKWQVAYHQVVMLLALIGAVLGFTASRRKMNDPDFAYERSQRLPKDATMARLFLLFVFCVHLAYLLFITVPRYNLTAMPVAIIFAAAGITAVCRLFVARNGQLSAISLIFVSCLIFAAGTLSIPSAFATAFGAKATFWGFVFQQGLLALSVIGLLVSLATAVAALAPKSPFQTRRPAGAGLAFSTIVGVALLVLPLAVVPAAANGRWYEWKYPFDNTSLPVTQQFNLPSSITQDLQNRQLYLMLDADGAESLNGTVLELNGKRVDMPFIPSIALAEDFSRLIPARGVSMREGEWIFTCMTESVPMRNVDLRQWFIMPLPADAVVKPGINNLKLTKTDSQKGTIYGSYPDGKESQHIPSLTSYSWEKAFYGVENPEGLSDTRYNMRAPARTVVQSDVDLSGERGLQTGSYNIRLLASAPQARNTIIYTVERPSTGAGLTSLSTSPTFATLIHDKAPRYALPIKALPAYSSNDTWLVRVRGNVRRNGGSAKLALAIKSYGAGQAYSSGWAPTMNFGTETKTFDFAVPLQPSILGGIKDIEVSFNVKEPTSPSDDVHKAAGVNELRDLKVEVFKLPVNPLSPGHVVL